MFVRRVESGASRLFLAAAAGCALLTFSAVFDSAEARNRRKARAPAYSPPYASLVVDANTGKVLHAHNADALRHPASITKVMTLFMLFEQIEKRKLSLSSEITISAHAASMPPTKLGLRPGSSITVEAAIKSIVTKSANDMAAAVGEAIGGSEDNFARLMTQRAKSLGMTRTNFENASGLPNPDQVTTAHDLAILGRAMRERFPQHFHYFGVTSVQVGRRVLRNHNRLLGRIEGVDGIKTGYTRASGFNLLTSAKRGNRRVVAVVLGGPSAGRRDAIMANLVETHIEAASGMRTIAAIADAPAPVIEAPAPRPPARTEVARADIPAPAAAARQAEGRGADLRHLEGNGRPLALAAFARTEPARPAVISAAPRTGDLVPVASIPNAPTVLDGSTRVRAVEANAAAVRSNMPSTLRWLAGPASAERGKPVQPPAARPEFIAPAVPPAAIPQAAAQAAPAPVASQQRIAAARPAPAPAPEPAAANVTSVPKGRPAAASQGVMIQVGATDDIGKAKDLLERARSRGNGQLASAKPFTEEISKGGETLYRARFAGLDERGAEAACKTLKRSGLACFTTRN